MIITVEHCIRVQPPKTYETTWFIQSDTRLKRRKIYVESRDCSEDKDMTTASVPLSTGKYSESSKSATEMVERVGGKCSGWTLQERGV